MTGKQQTIKDETDEETETTDLTALANWVKQTISLDKTTLF